MGEITPSIDFDKRLAGEDLTGSQGALPACCPAKALFPGMTATPYSKAWSRLKKRSPRASFVFKRELEDIHLNIEARLAEIIGPVSGASCIPPVRATTRW